MSRLNVPRESVQSSSYLKTLERAFTHESVLFIARIYFGHGATIKVDAIWEPSVQEAPIMYIVYIVANRQTSRETLDKNLADFKAYIMSGVKLPFNVLIVPVSFYEERVDENSSNEESSITEDSECQGAPA